jgi:hypothetical protein
MIDRIFLGSGFTKPLYWLAAYATGRTDWFRGVSISPSNQIYIAGLVNVVGENDDFLLLNIRNNGSINWQKFARASGSNDFAWGVDTNATTIFATGDTSFGGYVAAYNTDGSQSWQQTQSFLGNRAIAVDASGNNYTCGSLFDGLHIVKRNSSGTIQWERNYAQPAANYVIGWGIDLDSSGNVYAVGESGDGIGYLLKFNSSGSLQWQRQTNASGVSNLPEAVTVAPDGSIYWAYSFAGGELKKYDASGNLQWTRRLGTTSQVYWHSVKCNSTSDIYVCGESSVSGTNDFFIAKYNSSGTLLWQRRLGSTTVEIAFGIAVDAQDRIVVSGYATYANLEGFVASLPGNGTLTGTYTVAGKSFTYAVTTLSQSSTGSDSAGNLYSTGNTASIGTPSITTGNTSLTASVTTI